MLLIFFFFDSTKIQVVGAPQSEPHSRGHEKMLIHGEPGRYIQPFHAVDALDALSLVMTVPRQGSGKYSDHWRSG